MFRSLKFPLDSACKSYSLYWFVFRSNTKLMRDVFMRHFVTMPNVIDKIVEANTTSRRFERHQWHVNIVSC